MKYLLLALLILLISNIKVVNGYEAALLTDLPQLKNTTYIVAGKYSRFGALTVGNVVFVLEDDFNDIAADKCLLLHELMHSNQYEQLGYVGFLKQYLTEYVSGRLSGLGSHAAYENISLEAVAHANSNICYANSQ